MLSALKALKKFAVSVIKDRQLWYTLLAEAAFAVSNYFANLKTKKAKTGTRTKTKKAE